MPSVPFARLVPALALLAALLGAGRAAAQAGPTPLFTLHCEKPGLPLHVTLNGATIERADADQPSFGIDLNVWLQPGRNSLRVRTPPGAKLAKGARVKCDVVRSIPRKPPIESTLATFAWTPGAKGAARLDRTLDVAIPANDAPPCELWKRAEKLTLDAPTRAAVVKKVGELEAALRAGNVQRVLELQQFSNEDWVRCNGKDLDDFRKWAPEQARAIVEVLAPKKFQRWDPAKAKVELVAGGRVAEITVAGGPPIVIVGDEPGDRSTLQPFVARIGGALVIVR